MSNITLDEFNERYDAEYLDAKGPSYIRLSNGLEEGTEHESVWFCQDCGEEADFEYVSMELECPICSGEED